jgi:predicted DNA-binding transcriptional regulator AlpA
VIAEILKEEFFSFEEVATMLGLKPSTLKQRIYNGTDHPPYKKVIGQYVFPTEDFRRWVQSRPLIHEVRRGQAV